MADVSWLMETFACLHVAFLSYVMAILLFGAIPAALGYSFGLRSFYIKFLLKIFEVSVELVLLIAVLLWFLERITLYNVLVYMQKTCFI